MATLEKIRSKSVLLFTIIILALLAFILGDFLTSGRTYFSHPSEVAKANGVTVEYPDYQNKISEASEQMRNQGRDISNDVLSQNVLQGIVAEKLFNKEYKELGITVTDNELTEALTGENPNPRAAQMTMYLAQQLNLPEASGRVVFDAVQNPAKYNIPANVGQELRNIWASQEKDIESAMLQQKFMSLINGLYTYNKLDAKAFYDDNATTHNIAYISKDVAGISDEDIEFSDADIEALWKSEKQNYLLDEPMREVDYIYVAIEPSAADRANGQSAVESAIMGLNEMPGTEAIATDSKFVASTQNVPLSAVNEPKLRDFLTESEVGTAALIQRQGDSYTIAKLINVTTGIDSVNVSLLRAAQTVDLDSLALALNSGTPFADLNSNEVQTADSIWTSLEGVGLDELTKNALTNAAIGKAFVLTDTIQGVPTSAIYRVNKRNAPVKYYDVAVIEYTVDPSNETLTDLATNLRTFLSNNSSADEFSKNAGDAGYSVLSAQVGPSSTGINNVRDSRRFVKWALENKKGKVSPMMQDDRQTYLLAVAVKDAYDKYLPWNSPAVKTGLRARALNSKKADKLMQDYAGKANDLQGYAKILGDTIMHGNVNITTPVLLSIGIGESELQGAIAAAQKGQFAGPVKGNRGVLFFEVEDINTDNRPFDERDYGTRFIQAFGLSRQSTPLPLLLGKNKIKNKSLNFVQDITE